MFKSSPLSLHRHKEDLHTELEILKKFSFPQSLSVLAAREYTIQGPCKAEKGMLQKNTQFSSSFGLKITKQPHKMEAEVNIFEDEVETQSFPVARPTFLCLILE